MVALESSKLFSGLPAAELEKLRTVAQERVFGPNQVIFKEGETGDGIYVVQEGVVKICVEGAHGDSRVVSKLGPGDLFGEMAVLDSQPRSASAVADITTSVYFVGRGDLLELLDRTPRLAAALLREISGRLRDFNRTYIREVLESERMALVGRFASSIVHDLKNPLNIIGISSDLACTATSTADSRVAARIRIRKQVERISTMVNELLEFARQGGNSSFVMSRVDYKSFVEHLIEEIQPEVGIKSVKIEFENQPPAVLVDINPQRLSRVFHNLCGNATDAMPDGGRIKIRFTREGKQIVTELEDSGAGIAPEIANKLFQAFATYGKSKGTGLGLSICKKIVMDHHGNIYARNSTTGGGAIFGFTLPVAAV